MTLRGCHRKGESQTGTKSTCRSAASASDFKSPVSDDKTWSPSAARHIRAASIGSFAPERASSNPARRPSASSSGLISTAPRKAASLAWRGPPPLQTWATTPPCVSGTTSRLRAPLVRAITSRSPRSTARKAPASRIKFNRFHHLCCLKPAGDPGCLALQAPSQRPYARPRRSRLQ